jgi:hypothetical protein
VPSPAPVICARQAVLRLLPASRMAAVTAFSPARISAAIIATRSGVDVELQLHRAVTPAAGRIEVQTSRSRSRTWLALDEEGLAVDLDPVAPRARGRSPRPRAGRPAVVSDQSRASPKGSVTSSARRVTRTRTRRLAEVPPSVGDVDGIAGDVGIGEEAIDHGAKTDMARLSSSCAAGSRGAGAC